MKFPARNRAGVATRVLAAGFLVLLAAFGAGCSDNDNNSNPAADDTTAPVVGGALSTPSATPFSTGISWTAATDDTTGAAALNYKVVRASAAADIDTVEEADAITGEGLVADWTAALTSSNSGFLLSGTTYYFAVLVRDAAGNMALYDPVSLSTPAISFPKVTNLSNGNLLLVYKDEDDGGIGKSVVYDGTGQRVAGPTTIVSDGIETGLWTNVGLITHGTGVPVVSYQKDDDNSSYFAVLNNSGAVAEGPWQFLALSAIFSGAMAGGTGNSLFLATGIYDYPSANQQGGEYAIYDVSDGSAVKALTEFNHGGNYDETRGVAASAIGTNRFLLLYSQNWQTLTPRIVIYDETGTVQVADSAFATTKAGTYEIRKLANNNAFVAYVDLNDTNKGKFAVYQSDGSLAVAATTFADVALNDGYLAISLTGDGYAFIAYSDSADGNKAKYVVYDGTGALVTAATELTSTTAYPYDATTLSDNTIATVCYISGNIFRLPSLAGL